MSEAALDLNESVQLGRRLAQTFGRTFAEIIRARRLMEAWLADWEMAEDDRSALLLVVDELVTNAVRHGRGSVELYVNASDTVVRIEVCDKGGGQPRLRPPESSRAWLGGYGLQLVDQLADVWGTTVRPGRTVVWVQRTVETGSGRTVRSVAPGSRAPSPGRRPVPMSVSVSAGKPSP